MKFHIKEDALTITMEGMETVWALKHELVVPRSIIAYADWHAQLETKRWYLGWRLGTAVPGVLFAGTFMVPGSKSFVYIRRPHGLLREIQVSNVLELQLHDYPYNRVLVTVDDLAIAEQIVRWARGSS